VGAVAAACRTSGARGIIRIAFPALTDRATLCRPSGAGLMVRLRVSVALRAGRVFGAGGLGKAAAEPPHSKSSRRGGVAGARRLMLTQLDKWWLRRYRKRWPRLLLLAAGIQAI
jgi:hypothetical protein